MTEEEYQRILEMIDELPVQKIRDHYGALENAFEHAGRIVEHGGDAYFQYWTGEQIIGWLTTWERPQNKIVPKTAATVQLIP